MESKRKIYSVTEVNRKVRMVLESGVGDLWVEGELSRVTIHSSGHWYFTLKDEQAAVSCAMFRNDNLRVGFVPKDGLKVQMKAQPSLYEANGRYQLIASEMEAAGKGNLQEQFEKLKARLAAEGLFATERKKPLPLLPRKIGVVTSPTGAAIRDIINVLTRRFPNIEILLAPVVVQGPTAAKSIVSAIEYLNRWNVELTARVRADGQEGKHSTDSILPIDLLIVGRGGGSIEDLWAFNEEVVARAIANSAIPVISAVGHEIDFTIADFVADMRAPTPSAAAELAVREMSELEEMLRLYQRRLGQNVRSHLQDLRLRFGRAAHSYVFREPAALVARYRMEVETLRVRQRELLTYAVKDRRRRLEQAETVLTHRLRAGVQQAHQQIDELELVMRHRMERETERAKQRLHRIEGQLRILNPLAVLGRGYSLTCRPDGSVIRSVEEVAPGAELVTQLVDGKLVSTFTGRVELKNGT